MPRRDDGWGPMPTFGQLFCWSLADIARTLFGGQAPDRPTALPEQGPAKIEAAIDEALAASMGPDVPDLPPGVVNLDQERRFRRVARQPRDHGGTCHVVELPFPGAQSPGLGA